VRQDGRGSRATGEIEGAVVTMGNGVFFANRIDDGFAVVDAGVPGSKCFTESLVGFTDSSGRPHSTLRSYQKNKIAIDTHNLPVDADIATTDVVAPADRSGVRVSSVCARTPARQFWCSPRPTGSRCRPVRRAGSKAAKPLS
jgi:outer membrane usher protein FimD/PapC